MAEALEKRSTPATLFKIVALLGLVLAGVAALAAEPEPEPTTATATAGADPASAPGCVRTTFEFGGRVVQNGEATDTWTLTCWRSPTAEAAAPTVSAPIPAVPVATHEMHQPGPSGAAQF